MSPYSEDRLPTHDRRRRELLAVLQAEATTPERRSPVIPTATVAAVLVIAGAGVLVVEPWADGPTQSGPGAPRASAKVGDPVPRDIAEKALASCLKGVRGDGPAGGMSPTPASPGTPGSLRQDPGPATTEPPMTGPSATRLTPPPSTVKPDGPVSLPPTSVPVTLPGPVSAYKTVFTAWEPDGKGGLNPFVAAKAPEAADLIGCHGPEAASVPQLVFAPRGDVAFSNSQYQVPNLRSAHVGPDRAADSVTLWGYAVPQIVRMNVTDPDGTVREAVLRDGVWFANGPHGYDSSGSGPVRVHAYDASGAIVEVPLTQTAVPVQAPPFGIAS